MTDWQICRVLGSKFDKDDFPCIQVERLGGGTNTVQLMHTAGLQHRPLDPSQDGTACQAMVGDDGGSLTYAHLAYEPRAQTFLPAIAPGETLLYSGSGAFFRAHIDGRLSLFTTDDNTTNGRTISLTVAPTGKEITDPDGLEYNHPHCRLTFNGTGFHASHSSGACLDFGAIGGLPAPFSSLSSYATLQAQMVHLNGTVVSIGPEGGIGEPAAKATSLLLSLQGMSTAVQTFALASEAAATALAGGGGTPGAVTTFAGAFGTALVAFQTEFQAALTSFALLIPSQSVLVT